MVTLSAERSNESGRHAADRILWEQLLFPPRAATARLSAELLTLGTGFSYGSLRNRGLYVAQQTCCPEVRESKFLSVSNDCWGEP